MSPRIDPAEFRALPLEVHALLSDVPLEDVSAVDLPGGGPGRTLADVRALAPQSALFRASPAVGALFRLRFWLGRLFGWDRPEHDRPEASYLPRVSQQLRARSQVPPGTRAGSFRHLYLLPQESLSEIRNATVHAFLCTALREQPGGYRFYWGVYVKPISRLTPLYMAVIEPFRRFIVYPALFGRTRRAWVDHYDPARSHGAALTTTHRPRA
jgi:hypothetical protein